MSTAAPQTYPATAGDCMMYYTMVASGGISAQMGAAVSFDGHIDEVRMARALRLLLDSEPVLGYRFAADASVPAWQRAEPAESGRLLPVRATTDPDADASAFVASAFDPCTGPQVRGVVLRSPDIDTLVLQVSHIAVDGRGVAETLYRLADIHRVLGDDAEWTPPFNAEADRSFTSAAADVGFAERVGSMKSLASLTEPGEWPGWPDSGKRGGDTFVFGIVEPALFRAMKEKGRAHGATVNDIVLTAYQRSMCRVQRPATGARTPILMTIDLREYLSPDCKRGLSGFAAFWGANLSHADDEDFDASLARTVEETSAWKRSGMARQKAVASGTTDRMARGWRLKLSRAANIKMGEAMKRGMDSSTGAPMFTNIGVIDDETLDFGSGVRVERARWFPPIAWNAGCMGAATFRERLEVCMAAESSLTDPDLVRAIVGGVVEELEGWVT
jgi:NRPS condensation-like uncharacterized protein